MKDKNLLFKDKHLLFGSAGRASLFITIYPSARPQVGYIVARGDVKLSWGLFKAGQKASETLKSFEIFGLFPIEEEIDGNSPRSTACRE